MPLRSGHLLRLAAIVLAVGTAAAGDVRADFVFNAGVASGDMTTSDAILWTRGLDPLSPGAVNLTAQVSTDPTFGTGVLAYSAATNPARDYTTKVDATGLQSGTQYYYRFVDDPTHISPVGTFTTAYDPASTAPLSFGFSGDLDGQWRPHPVTMNIPGKHLAFFVNLGDTMYETASTGSPAVSDPFANPVQALADFHRKYLELRQPVPSPPGPPNGDPGLQAFYAGQGNYTLLDNHETGNKQFQNGGAPPGTPPGKGVDATNPANDVNTTGTFINQTPGWKAVTQAYTDYQPIREQTVSAPGDPRTNGTQQLYFAQQWGKNAEIINLDDRSYRDIRLKTASGADDTGPRADNPNRTMLGATQLAWFEKALSDAEAKGTTWKVVLISSPIDQTGTDGGKSWEGGYRAERNAIMTYIANNHIQNVVFLTTDDHQTRISQLNYLTNPNDPKSVAPVPGAFQILTGPLGAGGPDTITNHSFANIQALTNALVANQVAVGAPPNGLLTYLGVHNVFREGDPNAATHPTSFDFYSPDTFAYTTLTIATDGTLSVKTFGINSYAANTFPSAASLPPEREILGFDVTPVPEPSSMILLVLGLPLFGARVLWTRRLRDRPAA